MEEINRNIYEIRLLNAQEELVKRFFTTDPNAMALVGGTSADFKDFLVRSTPQAVSAEVLTHNDSRVPDLRTTPHGLQLIRKQFLARAAEAETRYNEMVQ